MESSFISDSEDSLTGSRKSPKKASRLPPPRRLPATGATRVTIANDIEKEPHHPQLSPGRNMDSKGLQWAKMDTFHQVSPALTMKDLFQQPPLSQALSMHRPTDPQPATAFSSSHAQHQQWDWSIRQRIQGDLRAQDEQRGMESRLKSDLDSSKDLLLEHMATNEEKLRQELFDQQKRYEHLLAEKERFNQQLLDEKDKQIAAMKVAADQRAADHKTAMTAKDKDYISKISSMETQHREEIQRLLQSQQEQLRKIQQQIEKDKELGVMTQKAHIDAKEKEIVARYDKKLRKYTHQIEQIVEKYKNKELHVEGSLEEARREIMKLQATSEAREQTLREELLIKDRRLISNQHRLDSVETIEKVANTWRTAASDLASIVIRACATVEDLPAELWTSTTPGLFTSVWDDIQQPRGTAGAKFMTNEDRAQSYAQKRREYVMASRTLLSKSLKFSKTIHERVKAEVIEERVIENSDDE